MISLSRYADIIAGITIITVKLSIANVTTIICYFFGEQRLTCIYLETKELTSITNVLPLIET